jgi:hypothetical protein
MANKHCLLIGHRLEGVIEVCEGLGLVVNSLGLEGLG